MKRIKQRNQFECGLATLAMVLDIKIEEAEKLLPFKCYDQVPEADDGFFFAVTHDDHAPILIRQGLIPVTVWTKEYLIERTTDPNWIKRYQHGVNLSAQEVKSFCAGHRAILTVRGGWAAGLAHSVAWDGFVVHDPFPPAPDARCWDEYEVLIATVIFAADQI
jgi:hypothetical protein